MPPSSLAEALAVMGGALVDVGACLRLEADGQEETLLLALGDLAVAVGQTIQREVSGEPDEE